MDDVDIRPEEWRWAGGWSLVLLVLSCVPYLIAARLAPDGWQFAGFMVNPYDGHSYLAKMQQGVGGSWLFHLTYTPEPHPGTFIFTFYLGLGRLAALTGLPLIWIFHLARLAAGFWLLLVAFRFIAQVTSHSNERRLAFIFLLTASGLGWLGASFGLFPIDLWIPEAFVPYSIYANPHFPLAMALMLIIFQQILNLETPPRLTNDHLASSSHSDNKPVSSNQKSKIKNQKSPIPHPKSALAALTLALVLPFALLTVGAILAVYLIWLYLAYRRLPWPQIWLTLGVGVFSAPVVGYDYWISTTHPILMGWAAQNVTTAPVWFDLVLGYGLLGPLAILGAWLISRRHDRTQPGEWLVLLWAATTVILVYLPFDLQRRLINGLHIPLCILAAIGLMRWLNQSRLQPGYRRLLTVTVIAMGALGTVLVWVLPLLGMQQPPTESVTTALFFVRQEELVALQWLREYGDPGQVVLTSPRLGTFVPGQTGLRAFYGHPFETIDADVKKEMAEAFYRGERDDVAPPVDFIIYGPSERVLGQPDALADYPIVFTTDDITIYKVDR
jgi:hypothetical protein